VRDDGYGAIVTLVAALDCGTNTVRLLVLDRSTGSDVLRRSMITRLGQGVDRTGELHPDALARTRAAFASYAQDLARLGVPIEGVRVVATSATRDARNRADFTALVRETVGVEPDVVSGDEEAALAFAGATARLTAPGPHLVIDIGGGSTELVLGEGSVTAARSMDVGSVRLTERHLADDPPTADQVAAAEADIHRLLDEAHAAVPWEQAATVVGVAGTVTTLTALALRLPAYDSARVDGARLDAERVEEVAAALLSSTHDERAASPVIEPGRVDVIAAGGLILRTVLARLGAPSLLVSEHDILDGIAAGIG